MFVGQGILARDAMAAKSVNQNPGGASGNGPVFDNKYILLNSLLIFMLLTVK